MVAIEATFFFKNNQSFVLHHPQKKNGQNFITTLAKKKGCPKNSGTQQQPILPLKISNKIVAKSAIAVLGLGFIDAGYSGDWSRIGVISKESEDLLKLAAFVVIPFCIFLIFSISREEETT